MSHINVKNLNNMTNTNQGLAGGPKTLRENETLKIKNEKRGRTIVMTTPWSLWSELRAADILGRKVLGWDVDRQNRLAYIYMERESVDVVPQMHLVDTDAWDGSWQKRLAALERIPSTVRREALSPIEKLVAWFSGRRVQGAGMVQKGGAA